MSDDLQAGVSLRQATIERELTAQALLARGLRAKSDREAMLLMAEHARVQADRIMADFDRGVVGSVLAATQASGVSVPELGLPAMGMLDLTRRGQSQMWLPLKCRQPYQMENQVVRNPFLPQPKPPNPAPFLDPRLVSGVGADILEAGNVDVGPFFDGLFWGRWAPWFWGVLGFALALLNW